MFKKRMSDDEIKQLISKEIKAAQSQKLSENEIKELAQSMSKEIMTKQSEEMMDRMKKYCDENEKIDIVGRMAFVMNECNKFTIDYVTQMLTKVFGE
ncbi:MAG: hypothetical protein IJP18_05910 [Oscillospiraceae bacterium]|nr:hypothetical protein [Ruminococcus sp.]MBP1564628.1 hypothetical protein [Oscillospiraceae bacterium]MBQ9982082.1 hypothetical protein [Oscillospiraceae bacterium]